MMRDLVLVAENLDKDQKPSFFILVCYFDHVSKQHYSLYNVGMVYIYSHCIFKGSALLCVYFVEDLERGIQDAVILEADEALLVTAQEEFDGKWYL